MASSLFSSKAKALSPTLTVQAAPTLIQRFYLEYAGKPENVPDAELLQMVEACYSAYRIEDQPLMADNLYDQLEARLLKLNPDALIAVEAAITASVYREHLTLPHEMSGITQLNDVAASDVATNVIIGEYLEKYQASELDLSGKLDGCSMMLHYKEGNLRQAFSKHTGDEGLDITRHALLMPTVPKRIQMLGDVYVRGEAVIPKECFDARWSASTGAGDYANPRNFVAGKLNSKTPVPEALADIDFVAYTACDSELSSWDQICLLHTWGFKPVTTVRWHAEVMSKHSLDMLVAEMKRVSPYELDGVVIDPLLPSHDESARRKYKIISETATTEVLDIEWNLHKDGDFRPVAILKPVALNGVTVSRASAFNAHYIAHGRLSWETFKPDHPLGPGAVVTIIRSGDVIPDIQSVDVPASEAKMPDLEYWGETEWSDNGVHLRTTNPDHPVVRFRNISYFFNSIGVDGFRGASVQKVLDSFPAHTVKDICMMAAPDFLQCGFGSTQAQTIENNIRYALDGIYLPRLMAATNLFGKLVAFERCEKIYRHYSGNCLDWSGYTESEIADEVREIDGLAFATASAFASGIGKFNAFLGTMQTLVKVLPFELPPSLASTKLEGWQVVFTGFRDEELEGTIVANGAELASWTKALIVVAKDKTLIRPKIKAALDRGAVLMSKAEFLAKVNEALQ